jgi:hypothetical protein
LQPLHNLDVKLTALRSLLPPDHDLPLMVEWIEAAKVEPEN